MESNVLSSFSVPVGIYLLRLVFQESDVVLLYLKDLVLGGVMYSNTFPFFVSKCFSFLLELVVTCNAGSVVSRIQSQCSVKQHAVR